MRYELFTDIISEGGGECEFHGPMKWENSGLKQCIYKQIVLFLQQDFLGGEFTMFVNTVNPQKGDDIT